jgi:hypothetical protein
MKSSLNYVVHVASSDILTSSVVRENTMRTLPSGATGLKLNGLPGMDVVAKGSKAIAMVVEGTKLVWDMEEILEAEELRQQANILMPCHIYLVMGYMMMISRIQGQVMLKTRRWKLIRLRSVGNLEQKGDYIWMVSFLLGIQRRMKRMKNYRI